MINFQPVAMAWQETPLLLTITFELNNLHGRRVACPYGSGLSLAHHYHAVLVERSQRQPAPIGVG